MRVGALTLLTGSLVAAVAAAITGSAPAQAGIDPELTTVPAASFHTNVLGGTTATISTGGNVIDYLSPDSNAAGHYEHIGVGQLAEGYVLCYQGPSGIVNTYDTGSDSSGFDVPSVLSTTPTTIKTTRATSDGKIRLTQTATFVPDERAVRISMTLKNLTPSPITKVTLRRQVDFDVDTGGTDGWAGFVNWHASTSRTSAFAFNDQSEAPADKEAHAMQLRWLSGAFGVPQRAYVTSDILDNTCNADSKIAGGPVHADYGETMMMFPGVLPANGSKTMAVEYSRF